MMAVKPSYEELERQVRKLKETKNKLRQYKRIVETSGNPIGLVDHNFIYRYVNEPYCQALTKSADEIIGRSVLEVFGHDIFEAVMKQHYEQCFAGETVDYQAWFDFPGWGRRYMDVRYYPFREADGQVTAAVVNVHDITEIKQLEMALADSEERFRTFMENNPAAIYIKDENDMHIYANAAACKSTRKKPDELIGSTTRDLWPPEVADRLIELDRKVVVENIPKITEEWSTTDEGETRWRKDIKFPIKLESGKKFLGGILVAV